MPYSVDIVDNTVPVAHAPGTATKPYLRIRMRGPLRNEDVRASVHEMMRLLGERPLDTVLIDIRGATTSVEAGGYFFVVEEAARTRGPRPRAALLARAAQRGDAEFMENLAVNRGLPLRAFYDLDESLNWLGVAQPDGLKAASGS